MTGNDIAEHCAEIERSNQRGGRNLSIVDLIEAGTLSADAAAYSLAAIGAGASFMVGALPGGAGKTTVMGALLNMVPNDVPLATADGASAIKRGLAGTGRRCWICHEIGAGDYYAYLWGEPLRQYFKLPSAGHMLATNLHADFYEQARDQVTVENGVPEEHFRRINLIYFLDVRRRGGLVQRQVNAIWESDGIGGHRQVFGAGIKSEPGSNSALVSERDMDSARRIIKLLIDTGSRTIEEVRLELVRLRGAG